MCVCGALHFIPFSCAHDVVVFLVFIFFFHDVGGQVPCALSLMREYDPLTPFGVNLNGQSNFHAFVYAVGSENFPSLKFLDMMRLQVLSRRSTWLLSVFPSIVPFFFGTLDGIVRYSFPSFGPWGWRVDGRAAGLRESSWIVVFQRLCRALSRTHRPYHPADPACIFIQTKKQSKNSKSFTHFSVVCLSQS